MKAKRTQHHTNRFAILTKARQEGHHATLLAEIALHILLDGSVQHFGAMNLIDGHAHVGEDILRVEHDVSVHELLDDVRQHGGLGQAEDVQHLPTLTTHIGLLQLEAAIVIEHLSLGERATTEEDRIRLDGIHLIQFHDVTLLQIVVQTTNRKGGIVGETTQELRIAVRGGEPQSEREMRFATRIKEREKERFNSACAPCTPMITLYKNERPCKRDEVCVECVCVCVCVWSMWSVLCRYVLEN
jgi:hypothetical protein